jgi:hypothetical protein
MESAAVPANRGLEKPRDDTHEVATGPLVAPSSPLALRKVRDELVMEVNLRVERFHGNVGVAELILDKIEQSLAVPVLRNFARAELRKKVAVERGSQHSVCSAIRDASSCACAENDHGLAAAGKAKRLEIHSRSISRVRRLARGYRVLRMRRPSQSA